MSFGRYNNSYEEEEDRIGDVEEEEEEEEEEEGGFGNPYDDTSFEDTSHSKQSPSNTMTNSRSVYSPKSTSASFNPNQNSTSFNTSSTNGSLFTSATRLPPVNGATSTPTHHQIDLRNSNLNKENVNNSLEATSARSDRSSYKPFTFNPLPYPTNTPPHTNQPQSVPYPYEPNAQSTQSDRSLKRRESSDELYEAMGHQQNDINTSNDYLVQSNRPRSAGRPSSATTRPSSAGSTRSKVNPSQYKLAHIPTPKQFPIASSRSTNSVLEKNSLSKKQVVQNYLSTANKSMKKRTIPTNFFKDPEGMYMDLQELRQEVAILRKDNQALRTAAQKSEADSTRKQKQVEELLRAHALVETKGTRYENLFKEVNLVKSLKSRIRELEKNLSDKESEFQRIKLDSRYTRVRELETELKAYYTESRRLQKVVEDLEMEKQELEVIDEENEKLSRQNIKLRELIVKMKQVQDYYKEQNEAVSQELRYVRDNGASSRLSAQEHQIEDMSRTIHELNQRMADYDQQVTDSRTANEELQRISDGIQFDNNALRKETTDLKRMLEEQRQDFELKIQEKDNAIGELGKQQESFSHLRSSVVSFEQQVSEKEKECQFLTASLKEKSDMLNNKNQEILNLRNTVEQVEEQNKTLMAKFKDMKTINVKLLDEVASLKDKLTQAEMAPPPPPVRTQPVNSVYQQAAYEDVIDPVDLVDAPPEINYYPPEPMEVTEEEEPKQTSEVLNTDPQYEETQEEQPEQSQSQEVQEYEDDIGGNYSFDEPENTDESIYDAAATKIQRCVRRFLGRRRRRRIEEEQARILQTEEANEDQQPGTVLEESYQEEPSYEEEHHGGTTYDEFGGMVDHDDNDYYNTGDSFDVQEHEPIHFDDDDDRSGDNNFNDDDNFGDDNYDHHDSYGDDEW